MNFKEYENKCEDLKKYIKKKYHYLPSWCAVKVKYKYSHESDYSESWEVFCLCNGNDLIWFNDWYEGQDDIEFLDVITDEDCDNISYKIKEMRG